MRLLKKAISEINKCADEELKEKTETDGVKGPFTGTTYREYAKENGHNDVEIEEMVGDLCGADAVIGNLVEEASTHSAYEIEDYILYMNNSTYDVLVSVDDEGNILEEYPLEY